MFLLKCETGEKFYEAKDVISKSTIAIQSLTQPISDYGLDRTVQGFYGDLNLFCPYLFSKLYKYCSITCQQRKNRKYVTLQVTWTDHVCQTYQICD